MAEDLSHAGVARHIATPFGVDAGRHEPPVSVIEPRRGWQLPPLREVWAYRDLLYLLLRRDVKARYHQTVVGAVWAVLQPVLLAAVFSVFLGHLAKVPSDDGVPYPVFALCGMTLWLFFVTAVTKSADSTVASSALISKVYFPRLLIPLSAGLVALIDFALALAVLLVVMVAYGTYPSAHLLFLPAVLIVALLIMLGSGLWLSGLAARYRDIKIVVPFASQVLMFITPVVYPLKLVPASLRDIYALNPAVGALEGFRYALLPRAASPGTPFLISILAGLLLTVTGLIVYTRAERNFADVI